MNFNQYAEKGNKILKEIAQELGFPEDTQLAGRILSATLHTLRDQLPIPTSFELVAQLPLMLKAVYMDGWKYHEKPNSIDHIGQFVREVIHEDGLTKYHDMTTVKDGENAIRAVLKIIRKHLSKAEIKEILNSLPPDIRDLWESK